MGLKHFSRKEISEQPKIKAQRERPNLLNNSKNNFFSLKITVLLDLAWQKMGGSNLLHPPNSTLNLRSRNQSRVSPTFTYSRNDGDGPCGEHINLTSTSSCGSFTLKNETHPPMKVIPACYKIHALNLLVYC